MNELVDKVIAGTEAWEYWVIGIALVVGLIGEFAGWFREPDKNAKNDSSSFNGSKCPRCEGFGEINDHWKHPQVNASTGWAAPKIPCPECGGTGDRFVRK